MTVASDPRTHDLSAWMTTTLEVGGCSRQELIVPLYDEHETAGLMFETWPAPIRNLVTRYLREWTEANPNRVIIALTFGTVEDYDGTCCVVIAHHRDKNFAPAKKPRLASAAEPPAPPECKTCSE